MKTKRLIGISIVLFSLSTPLLADNKHHQDKAPETAVMSMMSMDKMHGHMKKMKETMAKIHGTENKRERQKLMQKHMQEMHQGMGMMSGDGMQEKMLGMKGKHEEKDNADKMKKCHGKMGKRMDMMQGMMSQMMDHMMQQQKMNMEE